MGDAMPMTLGHLPRDGRIRLLLEVVVHPVSTVGDLTLGHFTLSADILGLGAEPQTHPVRLSLPVTKEPEASPPAQEIVAALSQIALYRMQEKARHEAELGQSSQAARRLKTWPPTVGR
jgi:hypothetical protein